MAYYDALIAKWGTLAADTTANKLTAINAITLTGSIPTTLYCTGDQIANCFIYSEFKALTTAQQNNLLYLCQIQGPLLGGSANISRITAGMIVDYFGAASATVAALTALAKGTVTPWWQASVANGGGGLQGPVGTNDLIAAGSLT